MFAIRPYHASDLPQLYRICLRTGDSGADATGLYDDPDLLGHFYAAPYAVLEPDLCFVLTFAGAPRRLHPRHHRLSKFSAPNRSRVVPGAARALRFTPANERDASLVRLVHQGYRPPENLDGYPAHLHIDLLPEAQGRGWGGKLMERFLDALRGKDVPGVHLGVGKRNAKAVGFYERVGFEKLLDAENWLALGKKL